jgi:hypothetical protein
VRLRVRCCPRPGIRRFESRLRWRMATSITADARFAPDSSLEGDGFEPSAPKAPSPPSLNFCCSRELPRRGLFRLSSAEVLKRTQVYRRLRKRRVRARQREKRIRTVGHQAAVPDQCVLFVNYRQLLLGGKVEHAPAVEHRQGIPDHQDGVRPKYPSMPYKARLSFSPRTSDSDIASARC